LQPVNDIWETQQKEQATFFPGVKDFDYLKNHTKAEQLEALQFEFA
jgi:hypothetical protein